MTTREVTQDAFLGERPSQYAATPWRVMTLLDKLYREKAIDVTMWMAGRELRDMIEAEEKPSEGVAGYGDRTNASPSNKADRAGQRLTGWKIAPDGSLEYGRRRSGANRRALADAMFAACGLHDQEGDKRFNEQMFRVLYRTVMESEHPPTLTGLTLELTTYYGAKSKQTPPFSMGMMHTVLGLLALHLGYAK